MKRGKVRILPLSALFLGILIIFYPTISSYFVQVNNESIISKMDSSISELTDEEKQSQLENAKKFNQSLLGTIEITDPYTETVELENQEEYNRMLNFNGTGYMASITIPKADIHLPIYHGTSDEVLNKGAGHLPMTSLPIGGEDTHVVISAHSGLVHSKMFDNLHEMKLNDIFYFEVLGERYTYKVIDIEVVKPMEFEKLQIVPHKDYATLLTCTPIGSNTHRLLVRGERINNQYIPKDVKKKGSEKDEVKTLFIIAALLIFISMSFSLIYWFFKKRRNNDKGKID
ncbi:class C sortase [Enterococcus faecalis]|uniref:class C sortase n=1 Tax=Enterococcus faecalis TaxID=1351 RepID=UPI0025AEFC3C|nr:class C sortase [Enterococcus faecalis]MDN3185480.1 class C sortase [Enterococcus faecalis]